MTEITVEQFAEAVAKGRVQYKNWRDEPVFLEAKEGWSADNWNALSFSSHLWDFGEGTTGIIQIGGETFPFSVVEEFGGEDMGSHTHVVFVVGANQYFKKSGYYASHHGTDWDGDLRKVKPVKKTITVFE